MKRAETMQGPLDLRTRGGRLRATMAAKGVNQSQLARLSGVNRHYICLILGGKRGNRVSIDSVMALAAGLNVPLELLVGTAPMTATNVAKVRTGDGIYRELIGPKSRNPYPPFGLDEAAGKETLNPVWVAFEEGYAAGRHALSRQRRRHNRADGSATP